MNKVFKATLWMICSFMLIAFFLCGKCQANTQAQNVKILTQTAIKLGVEPAIVLAFAMQESKLRDDAFNDNKRGKGEDEIRQSHGLMQMTFALAKKFGAKSVKDLYDARKCAVYACKFIKYLQARYAKKYSLAQQSEMYNLGEGRFFKGKTAHKYSQEWQKYYELFASTPNIDLNKKVSSRPPLYNLGEQSSPTRKHRVPRNTYIPTVYKVETVA